MDYLAILISFIALIGAGFAFLRANSSHNILSKRIETLKERNSAMELRLRKVEGNTNRGKKPANEFESDEPRQKNSRRQEQQQEARQQEPRQKQPRQEQQVKQSRQEQQQEKRQNEPRQNQPRREQPQQEQQPDPRQKQRERQQQAMPLSEQDEEARLTSQQGQQKRRKENRRRNEPMERTHSEDTANEERAAKNIKLEVAGGDLLNELEQAAGITTPTNAPVEAPYTGKKYAIIPEDGVIRLHQLQQQPDSDSYLELDMPAEGNSQTNYRFNLGGNHAFVIAQGIDRLENAFDFEKPSNRMVNKVVQQQDGVLTKVNNGWKIMEKARIDFR